MLGITDYLWRLIPANPILLRVVESGGKRRRDLIIRCAYLALLVGIVIVMVSQEMGSATGTDLSALAKVSATVFQTLSYWQLGLVALLAPIFTAGAITQEKDSQTYDILLATPLSNGQIVLGSLLSRLFFVIALLVSGIPVFSITQIFGGVAISSIVRSFGIAAATAFVTGSLAMAIAVFKVGTRRTIFSFYLFIVIYLGGIFVLDQFPMTHPVLNVQTSTASASVGPHKTPAPAQPAPAEAGDDSIAAAAPHDTETPIDESIKPQDNKDSITYFTRSTSVGPTGAPVVTTTAITRAKTSWLSGIHPFLALRLIFNDPAYHAPDPLSLPPALQTWPVSWYLSNPAGFYTTFMFALSFLLVTPSIVLLRRLAQSTTSLKTLVLQRLHIVSGDRTRKPRAVWNNPIAWREARTKASAARASVLRYGFIGFGVAAAVVLVFLFASAGGNALATIDPTSTNTDQGTFRIYRPDGTVDLVPLSKVKLSYRDETAGSGGSGDEIASQAVSHPLAILDETTQTDGRGAPTLKTLVVGEVPRRISRLEAEKFLLGAAMLEFAVILLIVTNSAASTVTREKEDGSLDLLLSTPITSRYYIWGKLSGLVSFVLPLVAVPVFSALLFVVYDLFRRWGDWSDPHFRWVVFPEAIVLMPGMLIIVSAFAAILGMQMSLRCRTTVMAVMSSVGIVVGICASMGWCGYKVLDQGNGVGLVLGAFSPFTLMTLLINPYDFATSLFSGSNASDESIVGNRLMVFVFTLVAVGAYTAVVWSMYKSMVHNFDMTIRKQSR